MPDWKDEILDELDKTNMNETEWKHVFKSEIRKYLSIKRNLRSPEPTWTTPTSRNHSNRNIR